MIARVPRLLPVRAIAPVLVASWVAGCGGFPVFRDALRDGTPGPEMVVVPAGAFRMGDVSGRGSSNERPAPPVTIARPFAVGRFEVSSGEYARFARAPRRAPPEGDGAGQHDRLPASNLSWEDAVAYARWLSDETGKTYRLLSEAEWEYVARGGTATDYFFGDDPNELCGHASVADSAFHASYPQYDWPLPCTDGYADTAPVGSFRPNAFGVFDVHGNVSEWVQDCWHESYDGAPADGSAWIVGECGSRVQRGGSFFDLPREQRSAQRYGTWHEYHETDLGLRIARDL